MKTRKKHSEFSIGRLIGAIVFVLLMFGLVIFTIYYDPNKQFSSSFFDDVSKAVQWR